MSIYTDADGGWCQARLAGAGQLRPGLGVLAGLHCSAHSLGLCWAHLPPPNTTQLHGQMDAAAICGDDVISSHGTLLHTSMSIILAYLLNIIPLL